MRVTSRNGRYYWTVAGSFLFVSALVIYHGSRQVLLEFQSEHLAAAGHQQFIQIPLESDDPPVECRCDRSPASVVGRSSCSREADRRGSNQSVVSYSLFGHPDENDQVLKRYFSSIEARAARIRRYYPGWIMRVYHNLSTADELKYLCPLRCPGGGQHRELIETNVDLCHVDSIRTDVINSALIQRLNPRMWRFLVMLDPLVDRFMSRDVDSDIIPREVAAVRQWLQSNFTFHVMRDHPSHGGFMLAGLWGAKSVQRRDLIRRLGQAMIWTSQNDDYQTDQNRLDLFVWPFATFDVVNSNLNIQIF
jgi:hypothetical protein